MTIWPPERSSLTRPAYRSLAQALMKAIEAGEVRPGDRLPTHRELAWQLGLSVQTIGRAYEELTRLDVIAGEVGRGTFVRAGPVETRTPWQRLVDSDQVIDCSMLKPVGAEIHAERLRMTLAEMSQDLPPDVMFSFRPQASLKRHREASVRWLERCGLAVPPDRVLPTNGNTVAMTVALMTAAAPGDLVVTEELGHHTLPPLARYLGLRLAGLPVDREGVLPEAFEHACVSGAVKVLYLVPNGLNPLALSMGAERRAALVELARRHDVMILENDAGGPLQPARPRPIAMLAPERTFYFTGFSKCLLPGLRLAYLVVPETLVSAASARHLVTNWMATGMVAEIATRWIRSGTATELLDWQKAALARRNRMAAQALRGLDPVATPNGLHVWLPLPEPWEAGAFVNLARLHGVAVAAGSSFAIGEPPRHRGVRICLGAASDDAVARGLEILARLARNRPEQDLLAV
ncbi:MAG TPA: PLP-dependent aminotransferase family protein [Amaricoccus sp.]|uniref:MocR-like ectoine utilization transcription factor EhuR n=1 Tax=Amaricoccus sp. TaxID=1872485 RepID=UPI002B887598|nr:PLP-dependent aminotransferase family protein [Amaricoccus sp.]HMR52373.1 PLP-dependent aminotransferase family protein [Amaricoccus sp.]HMR61131.1 PLP-dependent aminotransferase family protein [Amaricoccus sp.]HMT99294.1 PLP-dependent aminotransferase family protein [Amaricoccus sp.]